TKTPAVHERFVSRDATDFAANPEQYFFDRLLSDDVLRAIDALPIDFRLVVILADLQEFSYKEIAEILECTVGNVMSRLFRGRKLLQKTLKGYAQGTGVLGGIGAGEGQGDEEGPGVPAPTNLSEYRSRKKVG